ncbi:MAG: hypothetical protein KAY65_15930 [Planctomycetes bacterium]|nr:hypothetical protein [Planctomycetota bacterium]
MFAIAIIAGICLASVGVGYLAMYRGFTRSADDYFVAGSSLGYFVLIFSMLASFLSAFSMFGTAAITIFPLWGAYYWRRATRAGAIAATLVGSGMNATFLVIGVIRGENMVLWPQPFLLNLNGFLASFIVAGIVFFLGSLITQLGPVEKKRLALFFHPALNE